MTIRGRQFAQLQEFLQSVDNVVIDIGASNVEELLKLMRRYRDSQQDFDGFIVPTVPARKQQQDTAATLAELARIGVPPERLRLVFNQVDDDSPIERTFDTLLAYLRLDRRRCSRARRRASRSTRSTRSFVAPASPWPNWPRQHRLQGGDRQGRRRSRTSWRWRSGWRPSGSPAASSPSSTRASRRWTCSCWRIGRAKQRRRQHERTRARRARRSSSRPSARLPS